MEAKPPSARKALNQYYNISMQTPTSVTIYAESSGGYLNLARGISVECMPDGDWETFLALQGQFNDDSMTDHLGSASTLQKLSDVLSLPSLRIDPPKALQFGCRCSREKVENMIASLSKDEVQALLSENKAQHIICHMCGDSYTIAPERIQAILDDLSK